MSNDKKVCHITTVHTRKDVRIFLKQCQSLSKAGYIVTLLVNDGKGDEFTNGIDIRDIGGYLGRFSRITWAMPKSFLSARNLKADVYHFHDPELLPVGLLLAALGRKVIYDVHEDVPEDILEKDWIFTPLRPLISAIVEKFESFCGRRFSGVSCATPYIAERFKKLNDNAIDINNYPIFDEFYSGKSGAKRNGRRVAYVGGISELRGIKPLVAAFENTSTKLELLGKFGPRSLRDEVANLPGWPNVIEHGLVSREKVSSILSQVSAGFVTFLSCPIHTTAQPNKMFEYMSAGIPIVCSNFPRWVEIVADNQCGICVDPENVKDISNALEYIADNPEKVREMGLNARKAVEERYNWQMESRKLLDMYKAII